MKNSASSAAATNYARPFASPTPPALIPLPPGAVEPAGWLRDWCLSAAAGYTGHMDAVDPEFVRAWAADHTMTGERLSWPKGGWPYEGGGYWFDGLVRLGYALHDDDLIRQARERLDVVVRHMHANSVLFLWWLDRTQPDQAASAECSAAWPVWACGLLGRALSGAYAASADKGILQALEMAYAGDPNRLRLGWGMSNPWPAFDTYTWTGDRGIAAALDALFAEDGGGLKPGGDSWNRYRRMPAEAPGAEANDHVVHFLESTTPWALGTLWTGERRFLDTTLAWHEHLARIAMQPHGAPVADEFYGPTGAYRGTETCDVAAYLWSQTALLGLSGLGRLADRAERVFFNAGPATVSRDFRTHVYFQTPNRLVDKCPPHPHGPKADGNSYRATHYPLCCTAAVNRILPTYVTHLWMATPDCGLAATLYGPCKVSALVADRVPVELLCRTDYPFADAIDIAVNLAHEATFPLWFRIPGWCAAPEIEVNGHGVDPTPDARGFVRLARLWKRGDAIRLRFPMSVSVTGGRDENAKGAPYASVSYGPLLLALPIGEAGGPNTPDPQAAWRYALDAQNGRPEAGVAVESGPLPSSWDWPLAAPLRLRVDAVPCAWTPTPEQPLPAEPVRATGAPERITLVPYGCTKFRVSMFPVTEPLRRQTASGERAGNRR